MMSQNHQQIMYIFDIASQTTLSTEVVALFRQGRQVGPGFQQYDLTLLSRADFGIATRFGKTTHSAANAAYVKQGVRVRLTMATSSLNHAMLLKHSPRGQDNKYTPRFKTHKHMYQLNRKFSAKAQDGSTYPPLPLT